MHSDAVAEPGMSLRRAALVAGLGLLVMVVAAPFAEFFVYAKLVVAGDTEATVQNMRSSAGLLMAGIFGYLLVFVCDVIVAWALYVLLAPVNRALSLLTAWFRLVYTAVGLFALTKLATAYRLLHTTSAAFEGSQLDGQVQFLLDAFRYEWGFGLILFGIHLLLLGYLVYRSGYIPKIIGILLPIAGAGWIAYELSPFLYPNVDVDFLMATFVMEIVFMGWLLIRGWRIRG